MQFDQGPAEGDTVVGPREKLHLDIVQRLTDKIHELQDDLVKSQAAQSENSRRVALALEHLNDKRIQPVVRVTRAIKVLER
jgi:uncharacterized protein (UPF0147 family)